MNLYIGIDPGIRGAIAWYCPDLGTLTTKPLPVLWRLVNKKKRHYVDARTLFTWLTQDYGHFETTVICEAPHAMPGAGATSLFSFGVACGTITGVIEAAHVTAPFKQIIRVDPSVWKRALGCSSDKNRTRALAASLFPANAEDFARQSDDGKAEAALLAHYAVTRGA